MKETGSRKEQAEKNVCCAKEKLVPFAKPWPVNFPLIPTNFASIVMWGLKYSFHEEIVKLQCFEIIDAFHQLTKLRE